MHQKNSFYHTAVVSIDTVKCTDLHRSRCHLAIVSTGLLQIFILWLCSSSLEAGHLDESSLVQSESGELSAEDRELLKAYHHSFDDEKVDLDLIMHLLYNICQSSDDGKQPTFPAPFCFVQGCHLINTTFRGQSNLIKV